MAETISLEVARYCPERDAEPRFQTFEAPLREDWTTVIPQEEYSRKV